ncbi:MAG: CvpA family protein [Sphingomonadaceae bacterium]|nr:CvpA family protein [Sphingomonadaceae bacterium]
MLHPLTAFDIVVVLLVVLGAVVGALRGFVQEVLSLFAWVAGVIAVRLFHAPMSAIAARWVGTESGGAVLAFALIFLLTYGVFRALAANLGERTRTSVIGPIDRFLGFGFGAVKGVLGASLLFLGLTLAYDTVWGGDEPKPEWLRSSGTYPLLGVTSRMIVDFVEERRHRGAAPTGDGAPRRTSDRARDAIGDLIAPPARDGDGS